MRDLRPPSVPARREGLSDLVRLHRVHGKGLLMSQNVSSATRDLLHRFARWLADKTERKTEYVWALGCKHGLPNIVICPECDR